MWPLRTCFCHECMYALAKMYSYGHENSVAFAGFLLKDVWLQQQSSMDVAPLAVIGVPEPRLRLHIAPLQNQSCNQQIGERKQHNPINKLTDTSGFTWKLEARLCAKAEDAGL